MPRTGKIADGLRQEFARLVKKHGEADLLPLYLENGVYNVYLKAAAGAAELAPLEQQQQQQQQQPAPQQQSSPSGPRRQAQRP